MGKDGKETLSRTLIVNMLLLILGLGVAYGVFLGLEFGYTTDAPLRVVVSGSMIPKYNIGDVVIVKGVGPQFVSAFFINIPIEGLNASSLKVGDDIIFWDYFYSRVDPIVHRVIAIRNNPAAQPQGCGPEAPLEFTTHGINNAEGVNEISCQSLVIGVVTGSIPYVGYISEFLKSPAGLAIILTLIGILLAIEILEPAKDEELKGSP